MSRVAAVGAVGALGAVALVGFSPAADAAVKPLKTSYTCTVPGFGLDLAVPAVVTTTLPKSVKHGKTVPGKTFKMKVTLDAGTADLMRGLGVTKVSGTADKLKFKVGSTSVAVKGAKSPATSAGDPGTPITLNIAGKAASFKAPKKKGSYKVLAPKSFDFTPFNQDGDPIVGGALPCALTPGSPSKLGTLTVK